VNDILPQFVTFTGVDRFTDLKRARELQEKYPIEWALLYSPTRTDNRYATPELIEEASRGVTHFAVHLCGAAAKWALEWDTKRDSFIYRLTMHADRVQINARETDYRDTGLLRFCDRRPTIRQVRGKKFPSKVDEILFYLYDRSGGRGTTPNEWPEPPAGIFLEHTLGDQVGYAGGFGPGKVRPFIETFMNRFPTANYWIDMETNVRDEDDRFDLDKCQRVCEEIWGVR
jgi:hypothetical protein